MRTLTHEEYENRLLAIESDLFPVEPYINKATKIKHECIKGHTTEVSPIYTLAGSRCSICTGYKKITPEEYNELLITINSDFIALEPYINGKTKIKHKCKFCGIEELKDPRIVKNGSSCKCNSMFKPTKVYLLEIEKDKCYKVGISNRLDLGKRITRLGVEAKVIAYRQFNNRAEAMLYEAHLLQKYKLHKVSDKPLKEGNTELISINIEDEFIS